MMLPLPMLILPLALLLLALPHTTVDTLSLPMIALYVWSVVFVLMVMVVMMFSIPEPPHSNGDLDEG